jgi:FPC/CPF motif-containing protein YcgG
MSTTIANQFANAHNSLLAGYLRAFLSTQSRTTTVGDLTKNLSDRLNEFNNSTTKYTAYDDLEQFLSKILIMAYPNQLESLFRLELYKLCQNKIYFLCLLCN